LADTLRGPADGQGVAATPEAEGHAVETR
jgi:hypothetical protein